MTVQVGLGVRYVRYVRYNPLALGLSVFRGRAPGPPTCFLVFVFSPPPSALEALGHPQSEKSKMLRPEQTQERASESEEDELPQIEDVAPQS